MAVLPVECDPTTLINKQFLLKEGDGDSLYEITEVRFLKGSWKYVVWFEGCNNCFIVLGQEMMEMLKEMLKSSSLV
jgi:hypothetical protein